MAYNIRRKNEIIRMVKKEKAMHNEGEQGKVC